MMAARALLSASTRCLSRATSSGLRPSPSLLSHGVKLSTPTLASLTFNLSQLSLTSRALSSITAETVPQGPPITYLTLNNLHDNPGARKRNVRRLGRGIGSSKGKTSGRGHKGQKARAGKGVHPTFEGGQTKFYKTLPKVGRMKNHKFKLGLTKVNIGTVQEYITMGRLKPQRSDGVLTMKDFVAAGIMPNSSIKTGVKLLGKGKEFLTDKVLIEVSFASAQAIEAVEAKGGYVTTVHHNRLALRACLKPHKFPLKPAAMKKDGDDSVEGEDEYLLPKRARPPPKYMEYYTDYAKRGYLNPRVQLERKERGLKEIL
ncbi:hypothetical protein ACHAXN_007112 [Cyclotella atomus]